MPTAKAKPSGSRTSAQSMAYHGKRTKTGNSLGFRFEGALFKSHPEFNGQVTARVIAPGQMLVSAESETGEKGDPVMASFLAFLGQDIAASPHSIRELDTDLAARIDRLTGGVAVSLKEDLGDEGLL